MLATQILKVTNASYFFHYMYIICLLIIKDSPMQIDTSLNDSGNNKIQIYDKYSNKVKIQTNFLQSAYY